jgi:proteasome lid subunit RPN8/RPN11
MQTHPDASVTIRSGARSIVYEDVRQRRHIEACGLLLGTIDEKGNWHIQEAYPLRNIYDSPVYFEFAPEDLLDAELRFPGQIVGVYHSHPTGYPTASSTDRENMRRVNKEQHIPWIWLIVKGPFHQPATVFEASSETLSIVAYHHYEHMGLRQIAIQYETDEPESHKG